MKNINTIIVDLDRTLLRSDKSLSDYTISIMKRCRDNGIKIIVASARPFRNIVDINKIIGFDSIISSNGAFIVDNDLEYNSSISFESGKRVLELLESDPNLSIVLETGNEAYSNVSVPYYKTIVSNDLVSILNKYNVLKIIIYVKDENTYTLVESSLNDEVYCTLANGYAIQVMNKNATKWKGVSKVLNSSSYSIYFGDDYDDVVPIDKCDIGVAMENAIDECKSVSDYVCLCNDEDGVAHFIEDHILRSKS